MQTRVDEIADGISRPSTVASDAAPGRFSFNQFGVKTEEPLQFPCGQRQSFVSSLPRVEILRRPAVWRSEH
jgi:hypothetical protein